MKTFVRLFAMGRVEGYLTISCCQSRYGAVEHGLVFVVLSRGQLTV